MMAFSFGGALPPRPLVVAVAAPRAPETASELVRAVAASPGLKGRIVPWKPSGRGGAHGGPLAAAQRTAALWRARFSREVDVLLLDGWPTVRPDLRVILEGDTPFRSHPPGPLPPFPGVETLPLTDIPVATLRLVMDHLSLAEAVDQLLTRVAALAVRHAGFQERALPRARFGSVWLCSPGFHFRLCLTDEARRELQAALDAMATAPPLMQRRMARVVLADERILVTRRHDPFDFDRGHERVLEYLEALHTESRGAEADLWSLVDSPLLKTWFGGTPAYRRCRESLSGITVQTGHAHRDFHLGNLLWDRWDHRLVLTDWGDARAGSLPVFDVLTFVLFNLAARWRVSHAEAVDTLLSGVRPGLEAGSPLGVIWERFRAEASRPVIAAYLLDYVAVDLGKMTDRQIAAKRAKYAVYLELAARLGQG